MFLARRFVWRCRSDQKEYLTVLASENRTKVEVAEVRFLGFVSFPWPLTPTWQPNRFADSTKTWGNDAGADLVYFYTQLVLVSSRNASPRKRLLRIEPHSFPFVFVVRANEQTNHVKETWHNVRCRALLNFWCINRRWIWTGFVSASNQKVNLQKSLFYNVSS